MLVGLDYKVEADSLNITLLKRGASKKTGQEELYKLIDSLMRDFVLEAEQQTCKACGRPDKFDFHVPDEVWASIVPPELQTKVVCLYCFDEFAQKCGVDYSQAIKTLYFAGKQATFEFSLVWERGVEENAR